MKYSKIIVALVIALAIAFTVAVMAFMANGMEEPVVLIPSFFTFITGELLALAGIKRKEIHNGTDTDQHRDPSPPGGGVDSGSETDMGR